MAPMPVVPAMVMPVMMAPMATVAGVPAAAPAIANQTHLIGLDAVNLDGAELGDWKRGR